VRSGVHAPPSFRVFSATIKERNRATTTDRHSRAATRRIRTHALRPLVISDFVGLITSAFAGPLIAAAMLGNPRDSINHLGPIYIFNLAVIPVFFATFSVYGLYRGATRRISVNVFLDLLHTLHALLITGLLYALATYFASRDFEFTDVGVSEIIAMCLVALIIVPSSRLALFSVFGRRETVPVIVVGTGKVAQTMAGHLRANSQVEFVGFVDDKPLSHEDVIGTLDDLPELCRAHSVSRVVVCFSKTHPEHLTDILKGLSGQVGVSIVPRYYELITSRSHVEDFSGQTMLDFPTSSMNAGARFLKRAFDIAMSSMFLLVLTPLIALVAIAIKMTSSGPVFFRQTRTGRNECTFSMLKFRTMNSGAEVSRPELEHLNESDGPLFKMRNDPRVTKVGRFLRRTSLDEIPQLINVWNGDMSLVGPRPFIVAESSEIEGWARKRFDVRPGMTGLWQISGRNELSHMELARLDYLYVASWSFWWDINILWQTPTAVLRGRGAS
jgi:exopolysaccharide biosynthesis polyprenyl glycosylphosphotransferase